jgi:hypothetical protein
MTTTKETCPENCNRCSGEFCEQHGPNPCRCDVIERHKIITKETCPKCGSKYSDNGLVVIWFECGSRVIHENKRLTQSDRCRITELEKEVERLRGESGEYVMALIGLSYTKDPKTGLWCFCENAIGNPMFSGHSDSCLMASALLEKKG